MTGRTARMPTARRILGIAPAFACAIAAAVADAAPPDLTVEVVRGSEGRAVDAYLGACAVAGFGGVVLVVENDEVVLHRAYGAADPETGRANTIETRFDVGSIAKQIVATAMLVLQQDGRLAIDDPIALHVDGLVAAVPLDKRGVTIAHLLHHTSGLPVELSGRIDYASAPAVASALLGAPLRSPPGTTFEYNNRGYSLAAMIVERVAGEPFEQFAHRRLFDAAGLTHTGFCRDEDIPDDVTACGTEDGTSFGPAVRASYAWGHRGATGLLTTPADLYRWLDVVRHGDLLNDASRASLFRPGLADYALGWFVRRMGDQTTIWHGGSTIGFEALCSHERNERTGTERTIIQVSNSRGRSGTIPTIVGRILAGAGAPPKPATLDAPERAAMAGAFESAEGARIEIAAVGEFLRVAPANQAALDALS
ncbi:MAG: beta-lactamase family protein, partial [Phycisphaerales bacterium]|nr:beta-lactamase family protein [Phycisphaerales bacterium]